MQILSSENYKIGWADIHEAYKKYFQFTTLGWQDVATRYRRSRIGAFWLTINMAVLIAALGMVFGTLFQRPMANFLPYLSIGLILWGFLTSALNEGCTSFSKAEGTILQVRMPYSTHIARVVWRNLIIFAHNLLILPLVFLFFLKPVPITALLAIPGMLIIILNVTWIMLILSITCTRFRDLTQIIKSALQVFFYLTPIIWSPSLMPERAGTTLLQLNPFYHLLEVLRAPLLGNLPSITSWIVLIVMAIIGWAIALPFFGYYLKRVAYWL